MNAIVITVEKSKRTVRYFIRANDDAAISDLKSNVDNFNATIKGQFSYLLCGTVKVIEPIFYPKPIPNGGCWE